MFVRACQPQHDSWSKFVHNSDHNDDVSIEWRLVMSGGDLQTTQQYTWENVTMFVVVEDCNINMTTYLARPERCKYGNNNNQVVMKCCIKYGTSEAWV